MSAVFYGSVRISTEYPCSLDINTLRGSMGVIAEFVKPHKYSNDFYNDSFPRVQLRKKEDMFALVYFTYDEANDFMLSYLPDYWKDSELIWEQRMED